jgi:hypothetical protein
MTGRLISPSKFKASGQTTETPITYQEKTNKSLKSHNENEAKFTHPGHLV